MKPFALLAVAAMAATLVAFDSTPLHAQQGYGCGGWNSYYGYNYNHSGFERPPYFALYPPVYYSDQIVRRPMGISPFAAPPGVIPAEMTVVPAEPATIVNPYYEREEAAPETAAPGDDSNT